MEPDDGNEALEQLAEIRRSRHRLDEQELAAVRLARRAGRSWAEIAIMLGITRQSAWERWNELDPGGEGPELITPPASAVGATARGARRGATIKVPELIGMSLAQATQRLQRIGLRGEPAQVDPALPDDPSSLLVRAQAPEGGARLGAGALVRLWLRDNGGGGAGVREPRRPTPRRDAGQTMRPLDEVG